VQTFVAFIVSSLYVWINMTCKHKFPMECVVSVSYVI